MFWGPVLETAPIILNTGFISFSMSQTNFREVVSSYLDKKKSKCPIVAKNWLNNVIMLIHGEHLDILTHLNQDD